MLGQVSILVVDDEYFLAEITAEWLRRKGFIALIAANGAEAWKILQQTKVDVVISDVRMPVMDGLALLQKITASSLGAPPVILVTGHSDFDRRNAYDLGVENVLEKPVHRSRLLEALEHALSSKQRRWSTLLPPCKNAILHNSFKSIADAVSRGFIALGRGGFCIASGFYNPGICVPLDLHFGSDAQSIVGQGIVRWADPQAQIIGVEIAYLEDQCRSWVVALLAEIGISSFIPRETTLSA
jgi:CheY-like chemotaxis protein